MSRGPLQGQCGSQRGLAPPANQAVINRRSLLVVGKAFFDAGYPSKIIRLNWRKKVGSCPDRACCPKARVRRAIGCQATRQGAGDRSGQWFASIIAEARTRIDLEAKTRPSGVIRKSIPEKVSPAPR